MPKNKEIRPAAQNKLGVPKPKIKRGVGRPTHYLPKFCKKVEQLGRKGKSLEQISSSMDVDAATLRDWADIHPEFALALTRAKTLEMAWWEDMGQDSLKLKGFNTGVWSKSVSARFRAKYSDRLGLTGPTGGPLQLMNVTGMTLEELDKLDEMLVKIGFDSGEPV